MSDWFIHKFSGKSDYTAAINAIHNISGEVTVLKEGKYDLWYNITGAQADPTVASNTTWYSQIVYSAPNGLHTIQTKVYTPITPGDTTILQDSAIIYLQENYSVWIEVKAETDAGGPLAPIILPIGATGTYFTGIREED